MSLVEARVRYLTAIGAVLPAVSLFACKDPPPAAVADGSAATTTTTGTGSSSGLQPPTPMRMPTCPNGTFCTAETAGVDAKDGAPAPYAKCALTTQHPDDVAKDAAMGGRGRSVSFSVDATKTERAKTANACCYTWVIPCPGGRVFRDASGAPSVARSVMRSDWAASIDALAVEDLSPDMRMSLSEHWLQEAAYEHASIASFAQLTLDLLAVGAPPDLLRGAQHATLDEIEHARIAFALAQAYGGAAPMGPAPLVASPGTCRTLAAVARRTFIDACVGESVASAALAEDSRQSNDPVLSELLATMGADEERHAELAWRIVAWALRSGDPEVVRALDEAQSEVIGELVALTSDVGALAASPQHQLRATVLREIVLPCSVALLSGTDADPSMRSAGDGAADPRRYMTS